MDHEKILHENGFSRSESKVYLSLLRLGKVKSGEIIKYSELQSSVVHNALNSLIDKGFVTYILESKVKLYSPSDPRLIKKYLESKKQEFITILPELEKMKKSLKGRIPLAEVYEGWKGLYTANINLIQDAKKGDIYKYFAADERLLNKEALEFFKKVDMLKKAEGIIVKGISEERHRKFFRNYKSSRIKYSSAKIPPAMNIFKDKVLIISLTQKPVAILIHSKEVADQYHNLWNSLWKTAKI